MILDGVGASNVLKKQRPCVGPGDEAWVKRHAQRGVFEDLHEVEVALRRRQRHGAIM